MRALTIVVLIFTTTGLFGQTTTKKSLPADTIFKLNGSVLTVDVTTVTPSYVSFTIPGKPDEFTIERKEVHKIVYKNGRIEVLNEVAFEVFDESNWEAVWIQKIKKKTLTFLNWGKSTPDHPPAPEVLLLPKRVRLSN